MADCARHPDEVKRSEGKLVVDIEWYLSSQMVPPIARLCDPIDGTSSGAIAEAMGLDATRFRRQFGGQAAANEDEDDWAFAGGKQVADSEKFKAAKPLVVACPKCNERSVFSGLLAWHPAVDGEDDATADGAKTAKATASAVAAIGSGKQLLPLSFFPSFLPSFRTRLPILYLCPLVCPVLTHHHQQLTHTHALLLPSIPHTHRHGLPERGVQVLLR